MNTAETVFGSVSPGDWVIATVKSDYAYLLGTVTSIDKPGTDEHDTENATDDVHVDFTAFDYPPERIAEIEATFSALYGAQTAFADIPLDDVIMAPKMLIGISHFSEEERIRMGNLRENCEAYCACFPGAILPVNERHAALLERMESNLKDYHALLTQFGTRELIDMAEKINAMSDAHSFACYHDFSDVELDFLLRFQNPLEIVAEGWIERNMDISVEMGFAFGDVMRNKEDWLAAYTLMSDPAQPRENLPRRFMGVDIQDFLEVFSDKANARNPAGWGEAGNRIWDSALSDDQYDKRLLLLMGEKGCALLNERDVLVQGSVPLGVVEDYAADPGASAYFVEPGAMNDVNRFVNVSEAGNLSDYAKHAREAALPCHLVVLAYENGRTLHVKSDVYHQSPDHYKTHEGMKLKYSWYVPDSMRAMDRLMDAELSRRMEYPAGSLDEFKKSAGEKALHEDSTRADALNTAPIQNDADVRGQVDERHFGPVRIEMSADNFRESMNALLPGSDPEAIRNIVAYGGELEENGTYSKDGYLAETFVEFVLAARSYEPEVPHQLLEVCKTFALNAFEIRGAANLLRDGAQPADIARGAIEGTLDRGEREDRETELAMVEFANGTLGYPGKAMNPPSAEQKPSIGDRLRAGKEKADANRAKNPPANNKKRDKEME